MSYHRPALGAAEAYATDYMALPSARRMRAQSEAVVAYRRLDRRAKGELGDQLVEGSFDWMDWFSDRPRPDFLRGFKDSWNPEEE